VNEIVKEAKGRNGQAKEDDLQGICTMQLAILLINNLL